MPKLTAKKECDNSELILRTLKQEIVRLVLPPGTELSESGICARFSVSRTPVRSALQQLSSMKLIQIVPYRRISVSLINLHQLKQMIYMRIAIEAKVLRDFIDICAPLDIEKIRYYLRKQQIRLESSCTPAEFHRIDTSFHRLWFKTVDKEFLWHKIQQAQVHYTRFRMLDMGRTAHLKAIVKEHEQLFSILSQKRKEDIESFMTKHLNGGIKRLDKKIFAEYASFFEPEEGAEPQKTNNTPPDKR